MAALSLSTTMDRSNFSMASFPSLKLAVALAALLAMLLATQQTQAQASAASAAQSADLAEVLRLTRAGQNAQALEVIDKSLSLNPADQTMRFYRGVALMGLDRKEEAVTVYQKLVEDRPDMPSAYNNLAVLYAEQGDLDKARTALEQAIHRNSTYAAAYRNLGDVYARLAERSYRESRKLDKSDAAFQSKMDALHDIVANSADRTTRGAEKAAAAESLATSKPPKPSSALAAAAASHVGEARVAEGAPQGLTPVTVSTSSAATPAMRTPVGDPVGASSDAASSSVASAVHAWAEAWSRRDMEGYLSAYSPDFSGASASRAAWEGDRRARILARKSIAVDVSGMKITVQGDSATARFVQAYRSDVMSEVSTKVLRFVRVPNGRWLITQESAHG